MQPCTKCVQRGGQDDCLFDTEADLRRSKGALNRYAGDLLRDNRLLNAILSIIRTSDETTSMNLYGLVRRNASKAELSEFVERASPGILTRDVVMTGTALETRSVSGQEDTPEELPDLRLKITSLLNENAVGTSLILEESEQIVFE